MLFRSNVHMVKPLTYSVLLSIPCFCSYFNETSGGFLLQHHLAEVDFLSHSLLSSSILRPCEYPRTEPSILISKFLLYSHQAIKKNNNGLEMFLNV